MSAKRRKFGATGLEIGPLALGGNVFGWTIDEPASFRILDAFAASGLNLIDTADIYSKWVPGHQGGESETIIGKWLKRSGARSKVLIATKVGMEGGLSKANILRGAEDSLRRLQTDYIDLYQAHKDDPDTPLEETMETFEQLMKEGKVRAIGASNYSAARLSRYQTLQPHYNLAERADYEANLEPACLERGLGVIPYFSLASGFLTGKYRSEADLNKSARGQGVKKYLDERGFRILAALDKVAAQHNATPAKVSLAWLMARPSVTAPIASATSVEQLNDLVDATNLELDASSIEILNQTSL